MAQFYLLLTLLSFNVSAQDHELFTQKGKAAIKEFASTLKASLVSGMKSGGPITAINVCNQVAPTIAAELSQKYGFEIARTSLKVRNASNAADQWEIDRLHQFEARKAQGENIKTLFVSEQLSHTGNNEMRLMKAIPTEKACLSCHGTNIKPDIQQRLTKLYPNDAATGFTLGDIRGAFTIRQTNQD